MKYAMFAGALITAGIASAAPPGSEVIIANDQSAPVPVAVSKRQRVNACGTLAAFGGPNQVLYSVPGDRSLTIEYVSMRALDTGSGDNPMAAAVVKTVVAGTIGEFFAGRLDLSQFVFAMDGRLVSVHADPGTDVMGARASRNYTGDVQVCLSGELTPV